MIYAHKDKESYWQKNIFETFIDDFSRVVFYLPPEYSNHLKSKVIPIHSNRARIFDLKSLLVLRTEGIFDFKKFKKYYKTFRNNSRTNLFLIFIISVIPTSILIPIEHLTGVVQKMNQNQRQNSVLGIIFHINGFCFILFCTSNFKCFE